MQWVMFKSKLLQGFEAVVLRLFPAAKFIFFCFSVVLEFQLRALRLLSRCSATLPVLFALVIFEMGSHFLLRPA
jgi:hypothetical protein